MIYDDNELAHYCITALLCAAATPALQERKVRAAMAKGGGHEVRDLSDMMSAKFSDFLTSPPFQHLDLIYTTNFMQPPLLLVHLLFYKPPPPLMQTSYMEAL